jgi:hypothetical protein
MPSPTFLRLPINPDEGFPQAFRVTVSGRTYQFRLYANVSEDFTAHAPDKPVDLPRDGAFLVLTVDREEPGGLVTILRRKLVPGVEYHAAELALTFTTIRVDRRNLNGVGSFSSDVVGGVASR